MIEVKRLVHARIRMTETKIVRTAYIVCGDWTDLDDWAASVRCEVLEARVVAASDWVDSCLAEWRGGR